MHKQEAFLRLTCFGFEQKEYKNKGTVKTVSIYNKLFVILDLCRDH